MNRPGSLVGLLSEVIQRTGAAGSLQPAAQSCLVAACNTDFQRSVMLTR